MGLVLALLTLLSGSAKSISVCGINGALAARSVGRGGSVAYLLGLYVGALSLVIGVAWVGNLLLPSSVGSLEARTTIVAMTMILIGGAEVIHGAWLLPHLAWAVPRAWAARLKPKPFLLTFGFIRGVAIFNHSPFASMHVWLLAIALLPVMTFAPYMAVLLAAGLAFWTLGWIATDPRYVGAYRGDDLDHFAGALLLRTGDLGRIDGGALAVLGLALIIAPWLGL